MAPDLAEIMNRREVIAMTYDDDGFSLAEVIIAMFLLAVLSLAVLPLIIRASGLSTSNQDTVSAIAVANAHISELRAQFPNDPATTETCEDLEVAVEARRSAPAPAGATVTFGAIDCEELAGAEPVRVDVVVESVRASSRVELSTLVLVSGP